MVAPLTLVFGWYRTRDEPDVLRDPRVLSDFCDGECLCDA